MKKGHRYNNHHVGGFYIIAISINFSFDILFAKIDGGRFLSSGFTSLRSLCSAVTSSFISDN